MKTEDNDEMLKQAIINQITKDLNDENLDPLYEMLKNIIILEPARKQLIEYLSDNIKEEWLEGKIHVY